MKLELWFRTNLGIISGVLLKTPVFSTSRSRRISKEIPKIDSRHDLKGIYKHLIFMIVITCSKTEKALIIINLNLICPLEKGARIFESFLFNGEILVGVKGWELMIRSI